MNVADTPFGFIPATAVPKAATTSCRCGHPTSTHSAAGAGDACTCEYPSDTCLACEDVEGKTECLPDYGYCICAVYRCRSCGSVDMEHQHRGG